MSNANLPEICAAWHPTDGTAILIKRGESGYWPVPGLDVDSYNARHGITAKQQLAMEIGSMFGWHVPGANPENL